MLLFLVDKLEALTVVVVVSGTVARGRCFIGGITAALILIAALSKLPCCLLHLVVVDLMKMYSDNMDDRRRREGRQQTV